MNYRKARNVTFRVCSTSCFEKSNGDRISLKRKASKNRGSMLAATANC